MIYLSSAHSTIISSGLNYNVWCVIVQILPDQCKYSQPSRYSQNIFISFWGVISAGNHWELRCHSIVVPAGSAQYSCNIPAKFGCVAHSAASQPRHLLPFYPGGGGGGVLVVSSCQAWSTMWVLRPRKHRGPTSPGPTGLVSRRVPDSAGRKNGGAGWMRCFSLPPCPPSTPLQVGAIYF